jgi:RNA-directed DNA polymerase
MIAAGSASIPARTNAGVGAISLVNIILERAKSGSYVAPPVRRVHIPKSDGSQTRPIGVPTFEDKVLQRAVAMVLEAVYEQSFLDCSYGFRPGRSAHQALRVVQNQTVMMGWQMGS